MAGSIVLLNQQVLLNTTPTTVALPGGQSAHRSLIFYADRVTSTTGTTWTVDLNYVDNGGRVIAIGQISIAGSTGVKLLIKDTRTAPFDAQNQAIPTPNQLVYTQTVGAAAISCDIYAMYGD
jgi:hypothetical protein